MNKRKKTPVSILALLLLPALMGLAAVATFKFLLNDRPESPAWNAYRAGVTQQFPLVEQQLARGTSTSKLKRVQALTPHALPNSLLAMLSDANGGPNDRDYNGVFFSLSLLSADGIIREYQNWQDILSGGLEDFTDNYSSNPADSIQPVYVDANWLPFLTDHAGNFVALDFNPGPNGTMGQVISFGADEIELLRIAPNLDAFLVEMTALLTHPEVTYDPAGPGFTFGMHLVDKLKELRASNDAEGNVTQ